MRRLLEWRMGRPDDRILELLDLGGDQQVLDAGCGSGFHSLMVAERLDTGRVVSVDVSQEMLDRLGRNALARGLDARIEPLLADGLALPLPDASVDRALSAAVWHHLDDPEGACAELARVLRPGGRVVVCDLVIEPDTKAVRGLEGHDRAFGPPELRRIFAGAGLVAVEVETIGRWVVGAATRPAAPAPPPQRAGAS
jgi:SAM-dependent methyltransferase